MRTAIAQLRDLIPLRPLTLTESLRVAELQARRLRELLGVDEPALSEDLIASLPRLQIERVDLGDTSGATQWSHGRWLILLNSTEAQTRQRFSLAHELKHIVDHPFVDIIHLRAEVRERSELVADYFGGCLLMPRLELKRDWGNGLQDPRKLAARFAVSPVAMRVRLAQIGLSDKRPRCAVAA